ncbi:hypothetical protein [Mycetocola miduiensis]|uniref:Uncharacterized protein n=1 Tax=Mycetocola miduiensis TaxID=995034 RepID=A0A1I5C5S6_9MICO|nr:hypothetical protein [Mycetocola miduiensis]SFN82277.1 hypothetical protein SAMN05216219_2226 [Mycetocola miduiensis]
MLGEPIGIFDEFEIRRVQEIREDEVGGDAGDPLDSLGEAETLFVIRERDEFTGSLWLTDDWAAYDFGKRSGATTLTTVDVVAVGIVQGIVTLDDGSMNLGLMGTKRRTLLFAPTSVASLQRKVDHWADRELDLAR